jgi:hypothetical protein
MGCMTETHVIRIGRSSESGACLGVGRQESESLETLFAEIATYLDVVDAFRREGNEPVWKTEVLR